MISIHLFIHPSHTTFTFYQPIISEYVKVIQSTWIIEHPENRSSTIYIFMISSVNCYGSIYSGIAPIVQSNILLDAQFFIFLINNQTCTYVLYLLHTDKVITVWTQEPDLSSIYTVPCSHPCDFYRIYELIYKLVFFIEFAFTKSLYLPVFYLHNYFLYYLQQTVPCYFC